MGKYAKNTEVRERGSIIKTGTKSTRKSAVKFKSKAKRHTKLQAGDSTVKKAQFENEHNANRTQAEENQCV